MGEKLSDLGVKISLIRYNGVSKSDNIKPLFSLLIEEYPQMEWGAPHILIWRSWREKVEAAYNSGCRRFDGAIKGYGGCLWQKMI